MNTAAALTLPDCDRLLSTASQLQDRGDWLGAERLLRQVLNAFPAHAQGLHLAGILAHVSGQTDLGFKLIERAIESDPCVGLFHANAGEMARILGRKKEAAALGRRAVELDPSNANAWSNLGIALYDDDQLDEAERAHTQALVLAPSHSGSLNNLGSIWHARGDDDKAIGFYEAALKVNPAQVDSLNNLGSILMNRKQYRQAAVHLEAALRLHGTHLGALCNLVRTYCEMGKTVEVLPLLQLAVQLAPEELHVLWALVTYHRSIGEHELALSQVNHALERYPDASVLKLLRIHLLSQLDRVDEALAELSKLAPTQQVSEKELLALHAELLGVKGDGAAVVELLEPMLAKFGQEPAICHALVSAQKVRPDSAVWQELSRIKNEQEFALLEDKISYHFAMGKALDDLDRPEEAFAHYQAGCRLKRSQFDYRVESDERALRSFAEHLDAGLMSRLGASGHPSNAPIFVVGMMRSGTSLMEQIIASHPEVYGAGELMDFLSVTQEFCQRAERFDSASVAEWVKQLGPVQLQEWGTHYLQRAGKRAGQARRFTDKLPMNFKLLGLIHLVFPNARIIHMKRDPLDTCWSCYTQLFAAAHPFSFDLSEMGRYYRAYEDLMAHWRRVLPTGAMLEVQYEELVSNQEEISRQVLNFCGLDWSDACLQFHKTERVVRTASQYQVKQPMNKTSVLRSRRYEPWLGELIAALKGEGA